MSAASSGEIVGLCTSSQGQVSLHGTAVVVAKPQVHRTTLISVRGLYGLLADRIFCEIDDIELAEQIAPLAESIVSLEAQATFLSAAIPEGVKAERGWRILRVGTQDFSVVGVLASLTASLAEAGIGIFAISTFDTDYVLVKEEDGRTVTA